MNKWTSKKIAFIAVLIATSIAFVVIGAQLAAISSLPSLKLSLAGLPVKISGYLFGPIVGLVIGFTTDILTFLFVPTFYHPLYSLALGISGFIPGVFAYLYFSRINKKFSKEEKIKHIKLKNVLLKYKSLSSNNEKYKLKLDSKIYKNNNKIGILNAIEISKTTVNANLISSLIFITVIFLLSLTALAYIPDTALETALGESKFLSFLTGKINFYVFLAVGFGAIYIFVIIAYFKFKKDTFLKLIPIFLFIIYTEFVNLPIVAMADEFSLKISFMTSLVGSFALSPVKIWFNLIIILFATKIVTPLINNKQGNSY